MAVLSLSPFLALSLLAISVIFLLTLLLRRKNYPPGPKGIPIFGSLLSLVLDKRDHYQVVNAWTNQYGPIVSFRLFNTRIHILADMALVKEAFQDSHDMSDRMTFAPADVISGRKNLGIVFGNGAEWQDQRKFFASAFRKVDTSAISFQQIISEAAESAICEIKKMGSESVNPLQLIDTSIANIIIRIVTGVIFEPDDEEIQGLIKAVNRLFNLMGTGGIVTTVPFMSKLPTPAVYEIKAGYRRLYDFVDSTIRRRAPTFNSEVDQPTNFVECFLTERATRTAYGSWTERDEISLEFTLVDTLLAGWDPSTTTLMWILCNMAVHPAEQDRVRDEIRAVVGDDRRPLYSDHSNLPVTEAAIMESLRCTPVVDFHSAHVASRDCKLGGYDVSKGDVITTNMWYLAKSPKLWEKPEEFRPSRFLDSSGELKRDLEAMPFGYGRRMCPGEQLTRTTLFTFTANILQDFKLSLPDDAPKSIQAIHAFANRPSPFKINFTKIR